MEDLKPVPPKTIEELGAACTYAEKLYLDAARASGPFKLDAMRALVIARLAVYEHRVSYECDPGGLTQRRLVMECQLLEAALLAIQFRISTGGLEVRDV